MNEMPSTRILLHLAPNSTFFTSLPRTIGLTYGFEILTILFGTLSLGLSFSKWFFCWRYTFVMISMKFFSLSVSVSSNSCSRQTFRISCNIFPSSFIRRRVIFRCCDLLCLRCFTYARFAFSTSRYFVLGRWIPRRWHTIHIIEYAFSQHSHNSFWSVG